MNINEVIKNRRAYRSLEKVEITDELIRDLAKAASLAPSCFNMQPWRFVFVKSSDKLKEVYTALPEGNNWAKASSMIVAVYSQPEFDCILGDREYYLLDTGMATGFMILKATEFGLVAHPIAGYNPKKVKAALSLDEKSNLITLLIIGKYPGKPSENLTEEQVQHELHRPLRKGFDEIAKIV